MNPETLKKAKELEMQISLVEKEIKRYDPKNNIVCLQIEDHYGNKGPRLQLYAFKGADLILDKPADKIREEYAKFLKKSQDILTEKLNELKKELETL